MDGRVLQQAMRVTAATTVLTVTHGETHPATETLLTRCAVLCRPNFENFMSTVQLLKEWGADLTQTKLSAKHIKCPQLPDLGH